MRSAATDADRGPTSTWPNQSRKIFLIACSASWRCAPTSRVGGWGLRPRRSARTAERSFSIKLQRRHLRHCPKGQAYLLHGFLHCLLPQCSTCFARANPLIQVNEAQLCATRSRPCGLSSGKTRQANARSALYPLAIFMQAIFQMRDDQSVALTEYCTLGQWCVLAIEAQYILQLAHSLTQPSARSVAGEPSETSVRAKGRILWRLSMQTVPSADEE